MAACVIHVGVHQSQWPDQVRANLHASLRARRINPKFHYESRKQARHWLRLHEAFSPARRDADCQATYDRGAVSVRNVTLAAGQLNAGASADIAENGELSGRIVADVRVASQNLRATLHLGGTVKEPQVRN